MSSWYYYKATRVGPYMGPYCRMLRIQWIREETNKEVLCQIDKSTELVVIVKKRKLHILDMYWGGKNTESYSRLKDLWRWFSCSSLGLFCKAVSRIQIVYGWPASINGDGVRRRRRYGRKLTFTKIFLFHRQYMVWKLSFHLSQYTCSDSWIIDSSMILSNKSVWCLKIFISYNL